MRADSDAIKDGAVVGAGLGVLVGFLWALVDWLVPGLVLIPCFCVCALPSIAVGAGPEDSLRVFAFSMVGTGVTGTCAGALIGWMITRKEAQAHQTGRCPKCEYDLTGNVSGVCPECGTVVRRPKQDNRGQARKDRPRFLTCERSRLGLEAEVTATRLWRNWHTRWI